MNWGELHTFSAQCTAFGVEPPAALAQGIRLLQVAEESEKDPAAGLLSMTDDQVRERVTDYAIRHHDSGSSRGLAPGVRRFSDELVDEVRWACVPDLERIVEELRPKFDELAAPLQVAAQQYSFTAATSPAFVIDLADEKASAAYRDARTAWNAIAPIVALRIAMSKTFLVSPTQDEVNHIIFPQVVGYWPMNYSVAFAAGDNWSLAHGFYIEGKTRTHIDWLALAVGGLRLNSPAEVQVKVDDKASTIWEREAPSGARTATPTRAEASGGPQVLPTYPSR